MNDAKPEGNGGEWTLTYAGLDGPFLKIHVVNLLLSLVTLGLYRFWARTRERRYVWASMSLMGDRFEYTGTGKELFVGFLKAMAVFAAIFALFFAAGLLASTLADSSDEDLIYQIMFSAPIYGLMFYLFNFGSFSAVRYRMSRTVWRGIRFEQRGSAFAYANKAFLGFIIVVFTLGFYYPAYAMNLMRYRLNNLRFGTLEFRFDGVGRGLMRPFTMVFLLSIAGLGTLLALFSLLGVFAADGEPIRVIAVLSLYPIGLFIFPMIWAGFAAAVMRYAADHTTAALLRFSCDATGRRLFGLWFGNLLLVAVSFGLLRPMAINRTMRFYARHYRIAGSVDLAAIAAAPAGPRSGEGLAGYFDIDALPG